MSTEQERSATLPQAKATGCGTGRLRLCELREQERAMRALDGGAA